MFQKPRGTRDFTPEEMHKRRYIEDQIRSTFELFGYNEIQTPIFENLELFTSKSGEGIINELYSFTDKGGRELTLRPELTAPVIRFYVEKLQMEPKPLKMFYFGNCFRYDRPQKGRYREFMQAGCEIIGADTPETHAELIALAYIILENVGLKNIELKIGNLTILSAMFNVLKLPKDKQKYLIPLIDKSMFEDLLSALQDFGIKPKDATDFLEILQTTDVKKIAEYLKNDKTALDELLHLEQIINLLKNSFKINNYEIKTSIVRGLDYYNGIVFEIDAPALGAEKQLCGGGAYDLVTLFGGRETSTAGFALGFDRTILALETDNYDFPSKKLKAYVIPINQDTVNKSLQITQKLRMQGVSADVDLLQRGISRSLKYASSINAEKAIIIGPDELEQDSVTVRDMKTGKQEKIKIKEIKNIFL